VMDVDKRHAGILDRTQTSLTRPTN
jgi:hypothetical protein